MQKDLDEKSLKDYCNNRNDLDWYLCMKGQKHRYYRHYDKLPRIINNIYKDQALYLGDGSNWNDNYDRENFTNGKNGKQLYGICFSYSIDESVAMWMLYDGLEDKGGMFYFTQKQMNNIIKKCNHIELGNFDDNNVFHNYIEINNDSFKLYIKDVVYYKENKNKKTFFIQRDRDVKQGVSKKTLGGGNPVIKPIGWSYEKETRLIIEISNPTKEMFDMKYAKISLASTMDENWLNSFYKQIVYSPKCDIGKHEHGVYNNKKVTFKTSVLKDIINWEIR